MILVYPFPYSYTDSVLRWECSMDTVDIATVQALRQDLALQIARFLKRNGLSQVAAAQSLAIPQPTLSKIANAQVSDLSLELLIRIAVRAKLSLVLHTGKDPSEAGVCVAGSPAPDRVPRSLLSQRARAEVELHARSMTPESRLDAQLRHSKLLAELQAAGGAASHQETILRKVRRR
jgi:predicted XRE-type DNA-binding protein